MENFRFICWDWKEQPDFDLINEALRNIEGKAAIHEVDTRCDYCCIVVHSTSITLDEQEWNDLYSLYPNFLEEEEIKDNIFEYNLEQLRKLISDYREYNKQQEEIDDRISATQKEADERKLLETLKKKYE